MAKLKAGVTVPAVVLSLIAATGASAEVGSAPAAGSAVERNAADTLMRTYGSPEEAIAALRAAGRHDLLAGTVQGFTQAVGNPSGEIGTSDWYALFGSECCLVVLDKVQDSEMVAGETSLTAALQRGAGVARRD